jgi:hypothetical protein
MHNGYNVSCLVPYNASECLLQVMLLGSAA